MSTKQKILSTIGALAAVIIGYFLYEHFVYVTTDNAQVEAHAIMLSPKVGGFVTEVKIVEGQKVKKDDLLVKIDSRDYQNVLNQAKGELTALMLACLMLKKTLIAFLLCTRMGPFPSNNMITR